jgi:hypothetical protein
LNLIFQDLNNCKWPSTSDLDPVVILFKKTKKQTWRGWAVAREGRGGGGGKEKIRRE